MCSGIWTWITSAPQSASWRAAVGPARTCVRSMTRKRERAWEAGRCGMAPALLVLDDGDQGVVGDLAAHHVHPGILDRDHHLVAHVEAGAALVAAGILLQRLLGVEVRDLVDGIG